MTDSDKTVVGAKVNPAFGSHEQTLHQNASGQNLEKNEMELKTTELAVPQHDRSAVPTDKTRKENNIGCIRGILVVAVVAVSIALCVILVLYVKELRDSDDPEPKGTVTQKTCFEERCIAGAADLLGYMNRSAHPCQDFYNFACGGWQRKTFMPTTSTSVHILMSLHEANQNLFRNLLADPATRRKYSQNRAVMKAMDLYQTCLSQSTINKQGDSFLKDVIKSLGGSNLTTAGWNSSQFDIHEVLLKTFGQLGVQPLFTLQVFADFLNSSIRRFTISEGGLGLANVFYVEKNSSNMFYSKTREAYKEYMVDLMALLGANRYEAQRQMMDVYWFEEKIAHVIKNYSAFPEMSTIRTLTNRTKFDWFSFLSGLTSNYSYNLTADEAILVRTVKLFEGVMAVVNSTDKATLSNYVAWTVIGQVIDHLPNEYREARLAYKKKTLGQTFEDQERWKTCFDATKQAFPMPIGLIFVDKKLSPEAKERAKEIFEEIKAEFVDELSSQTWMDEETIMKAKEKANATNVLVGYPEYIKDDVKLNKKYEKMHIDNDSYLQTIFNTRKFSFQAKLADLKRPVDRNEFPSSPVDVNAFHSPQENKNIFLAGILQSPFYGENKLRASNYGGIGMVAGHELTHGFDNQGRSFDKHGNRANWWTANSSSEFNKKTKCLEEQYGQYELFGKKVNGKMTLGENIADNGGLKFAFRAYKRWVARHGEEDRLPGVDFAPDQLFFISYAQGWCSKYTLQGALEQLDNKPWPPMNIRVEGVIKNSKEFADAFKCKAGSPMNPQRKCSLW